MTFKEADLDIPPELIESIGLERDSCETLFDYNFDLVQCDDIQTPAGCMSLSGKGCPLRSGSETKFLLEQHGFKSHRVIILPKPYGEPIRARIDELPLASEVPWITLALEKGPDLLCYPSHIIRMFTHDLRLAYTYRVGVNKHLGIWENLSLDLFNDYDGHTHILCKVLGLNYVRRPDETLSKTIRLVGVSSGEAPNSPATYKFFRADGSFIEVYMGDVIYPLEQVYKEMELLREMGVPEIKKIPNSIDFLKEEAGFLQRAEGLSKSLGRS